MIQLKCQHSVLVLALAAWFGLLFVSGAIAQQSNPANSIEIYSALKKFDLSGGSVQVKNLVLKRDRAEMTFDGTIYFQPSVAGAVRGCVFIGNGHFRAEVPDSLFERDNVKRLLNAELVESTFEHAVLRFSDESFDLLAAGGTPGGPAPPEALELAKEFEARFLKETGANLSARLLVSILNRESPGVFFAQFDKGSRGRFSFLLDYQSRIPVANFDINGGEKGLIFAYRRGMMWNDIWMAVYALEDYQQHVVNYSDLYDLVQIRNYTMHVDLREPKKALKLNVEMNMSSSIDGLRAVPLVINDGLGEYENERLKKAMKVKSAKSDSGGLDVIQEDWEAGITLVLPTAPKKNEQFSAALELEGDFLLESSDDFHYPLSNESWYPRHGYLNRSTFHMTFLHRRKHLVASSGDRIRENATGNDDSEGLTEYRMEKPVSLVTFAFGPYEHFLDKVKLQQGGIELPVEFNAPRGRIMPFKQDFIVTEMMNSVNYFSLMFGAYPYGVFRGAFHPFGFGQGFPTLLMIPPTTREHRNTYSFIAHETAHQWWGNIVAWRSYRDQWLSEGFAEYSGMLYTGLRDNFGQQKKLIEDMRIQLRDPPSADIGLGRGRLVDVGPVILGHRLSTRETLGAYTALVYSKGALILRMLHFLFTNPANGDGKPFFEMMTDFVKRYSNGRATTENFAQVASEHFGRTPIAQRFGMKDLKWFFRQWVYEAHHPIYRLEFRIQAQPDGNSIIEGTLHQEKTPEYWFMVLPLVVNYDKDKKALATVYAKGPKTTFSIKVPGRPESAELDPDLWVLSEKTSTKKQ